MATFTFTCDIEAEDSLIDVLRVFMDLTGFPFEVSTETLRLHDYHGPQSALTERYDARWRVQY